jgi:hypothetical protein
MTDNAPAARVVSILKLSGYTEVAAPIVVAEIEFDVGTPLLAHHSLNLVLVVDTVEASDQGPLRRHIEGLSRALDAVESRRTLTVVFAGPPPSLDVSTAVSRVARVLTVGTPVGPAADNEVRTSLAVLLPLPLPAQDNSGPSWDEARAALLAELDPHLVPLVEASTHGAAAVEDSLGQLLAEPFAGVDLA